MDEGLYFNLGYIIETNIIYLNNIKLYFRKFFYNKKHL